MDAIDEVTFSGRRFTAQEVELMRVVARDYAGLGVTEIARTICELLEGSAHTERAKNRDRCWSGPRWDVCFRVPGRNTLRHVETDSRQFSVGRNRGTQRQWRLVIQNHI